MDLRQKNQKGIELYKKAKEIIPGGTGLLSKRPEMFLPELWPSYYQKAKGCYVWDLDGNKYLDFSYMGIGACILGYSDDDINKAVKDAVDNGSMNTLNCPEEVELAELLLKIHPWAGMVRYARTGGESMAVAIRIARAFSGRDKVAFCYDDQTEILTKSGFKLFKDLADNELVATLNPQTEFLEYRQIEQKINYSYKGKMIHFKGQRVDLMVTPDHKVYRRFRLKKGEHFKLVEAKELLKRKSMTQMTSICGWEGAKEEKFYIPKIKNQTRPTKNITSFLMKDFVRFMGWYLSEGFCINQASGRYEVGITQDIKNDKKSKEIFTVIKKLGFTPYRNSHHINFSSKELVLYLKQFGKCKDKFVPDWIKSLSQEYLKIFVDAMVKGDGTFEKGRMRKFYSSSKRLIDDMQEIFLKLGYSTTFSRYDGNGFAKGTIYHLNIGSETLLGSRPKEVSYDGHVYCVTVPNHIILVRRNGKIVWSGNCGYHGWSDWYLSANLANDKNLDGHLLAGLLPNGVPRGLYGTMLPFHFNKIEELEKIVAENSDIGVIVMEPMKFQANEGSFLAQVREIANKINAVLIFDEITVGFRFNIGGAHLALGVTPDMAVFAKGISNGFAMGAIIGKKEIMQSAQTSFISSTYWTERIGPVAAVATINKMIKENAPDYLQKTGLKIKQGLLEMARKHNIDLHVEGNPAMLHISFNYPNAQAIRTLYTQEMLKRNVLATGGIYVSLAFKDENIEEFLKAIDDVFLILKNAIEENKVEQMLEGPIAHSSFQRLN